jgi:hypothetical protein
MDEPSSVGAALVAIRWAKATKEQRLAEGRRLAEARRAKARAKRKKKKASK